ncbi:acyltransferase [Bacteroides sp. 214]|uniref:acyltransferase n=1 Tax=Bacteroides sp. 214 TaxID=2302935 RepID=UPI0013D1E4F7|nr:acyltransferase [Bacteroides sp. 214]NDW12577.1 acyltransferase [Bacteroides sp. 214]
MNTTEFDEIRPYHDEELPQIYEELIADPAFRNMVAVAFPDIPFDQFAAKMRQCKTKSELQRQLVYRLMWMFANNFSDGLTGDFTSLPSKEAAYTFITNHRDIILDSGFLSILLLDNGMETVEIAIGDNLLVYPWIKKLVRVVKSFIVQRGLTMRQILESSARMSRYMHYTITEKKHSIWIAQREGRAKDSNDRTQESIVKMIAMGKEGNMIDSLTEMNITPLALSYEYDPCDFLKAKEFQQKRDDATFKKSQQDDLENMKTGLIGYKGRVHLQTGTCITGELQKLDRTLPKAELVPQVVSLIDTQIHRNYRMYPGNYVALDLLNDSNIFASHYSLKEKARFEEYINGQLDKIDLPNKDIPFLRHKLLLMYANPLKNYLAALKG